MNKSQGTIIGTVLISSIIIGIVSVSYLWGKPLIDKSTDKVRINSLISKMKNLESSIETVSQGGSQTVDMSLESDERLEIEDNKITLTTHTSVPIITSLSWAPLNSYELPFRKNVYLSNNSEWCDPTDTNCPCYGSWTSGNAVNATYDDDVNISGTGYYVCSYNMTRDNDIADCNGYCYGCINKTSKMGTKDCATADENVENINYLTIELVGKNRTIISGNETTVSGILGEDLPGILMGKTTPTGNRQEVKFRIRFRPLINEKGRGFKIVPKCEGSCVVEGGEHTIKVRKEKTVKKADSTITYISLSIG